MEALFIFIIFCLVCYLIIENKDDNKYDGFKKDANIFFETNSYIAGMPHVMRKWNKNDLKVGTDLQCVRENNNSNDLNAIALHLNGSKIGYIPRNNNLIHAKHMDAGGKLSVKIKSIDFSDEWKGVKIKIINI